MLSQSMRRAWKAALYLVTVFKEDHLNSRNWWPPCVKHELGYFKTRLADYISCFRMFCNCRRLLIISSITKQKHFQGRYVCWRCQWWFSFHGPVCRDFIVAFNECVSYLTKCLTSSQLTAHDLEQILAAHTTLNTWPQTQRASPHTKSRSDYADIKREKREWQETKRKVTTCTPPFQRGLPLYNQAIVI